MIRRDSASAVGDRKLDDVTLRFGKREAGPIARGNADRAFALHCIARIDADIDQRKLEFAGIDLDWPEAILEMRVEMNIATERAGKDFLHAFDVPNDIDRFRIDRALPRKRQQMSRQRRAAPDGLPHARHDPRTLRRIDLALQELNAARHDREQIVEVMRDAAGELAERFQLLCM